ncbi:MAG TPA: sulfatase [Actinopolymorphaceae bacterium]
MAWTTKNPGRARPVAGMAKAAVLLLTLGLVGAVGVAPSAAMPMAQPADSKDLSRPERNIVFILTDDFSKNLVPYMSAVRAMKKRGTTFSHAFVADGLCCPSRASILTGRYPHNTKVRVNEGDRRIPGGYRAFRKFGNHKRTYAVALPKRYRTGFLGKYLNGYKIRKHPVPPGWDEWHVSGNGYTNVGGTYDITTIKSRNQQGRGISKPKAYLNNLLGRRARAFVDRAHANRQPFFLQISTFAPHQRIRGKHKRLPLFPPAKKDRPGEDFTHGDCGTKPGGGRYDCAKLRVRRTGAFDDATYDTLDRDFRNRIRMMQSLNDELIELRKRLKANGQLRNTYFVFMADNGYHLGEHGLLRGKGSAYDHDVRVPLIIEGPGVKGGQVRHEIVQNVDLYATFQQMAGLRPKPSDGRGLMTLLRGGKAPNWRDAALIEHKPQLRKGKTTADPDLDGDRAAAARAGFVPAFHAYNAIRTKHWLYVKHTDSSRRELYDLEREPGQYHNVWRDHPRLVKYFNKWLKKYVTCGKKGKRSCWKAGHAPPVRSRHEKTGAACGSSAGCGASSWLSLPRCPQPARSMPCGVAMVGSVQALMAPDVTPATKYFMPRAKTTSCGTVANA